jgi:hypothetical protein
MGTRNSTLVYLEGKTRIAQYGQWDGYPTGQGKTIAEFLKKVDLPKFIAQVKALKTYTRKGVNKIWEKAGADPKTGFISLDKADVVKKKYPELNRDTGAEILQLIHDGVVTKVFLDEKFKEDTLFCEYYYEIDLDNKKISVNGGKKYPFKAWTPQLMKKLEAEKNKE